MTQKVNHRKHQKKHLLNLLQTSSVAIDSLEIEMSHWLVPYRPNSNRPIIVMFLSCYTKNGLLLANPKQKDSAFSLSEDFSPTVGAARARLFDYGKTQAQPFKLPFNKLHIANSVFPYRSEAETVKKLTT